MPSIIFIDTEIDPGTNRILDIGALKENGDYFHQNSLTGLTAFLSDADFICGHNILQHDVKYLQNELTAVQINPSHIIDTLYLSPLLFPKKPYHKLLKDDKLQPDEYNNPLNDCIKAKSLFEDEVSAFKQLDDSIKSIYYLLLKERPEFSGFFSLLNFITTNESNPELLIRQHFAADICNHSNLSKYIAASPVELAYCLALINCRNKYSITPPWIRKNFLMVEQILLQLRHKPCITGCQYCNRAMDIHEGLKKFFGFNAYRTYGGVPLQEKAVKAAIDNKSLLAVFPTGGGKSVTFQVPALMSGETVKGLTVVISPLQSLMKDQVDNLYRSRITDAATINGLLDPIERKKAMESVQDGTASLLYISPESLRSKTIEHLLLNRNIVRFVIDEAHCFSAWGQDFRVDYLYIADFIKSLQQKKSLNDPIPVSCFTATAKPNVIEDIRAYFRDKLSLELELFSTTASRTNLQYKVYEKNSEEEKYIATRDLLEEKNCPTIIYVSRTKNAYSLAERLTADGFNAKPYHGKMEVKEKTENQNAFMAGDVSIMVATSAFGMGVDKKDVGLVIHYDISDSLENYIQEAGRAGRDDKIKADCFVLFNEDDLGKHFILLNQTKLDISEIKQVWNAIKYLSKFRSKFSNSALEIARKAGWTEDKREIETRVKTAIAALEEAKYVQRGHNMPKVFADSILSKTANEAAEKINKSERFIDEKQKSNGIRIIKKLLSSKNRKRATEDSAESRVDYIADQLGIPREEVITIINILREEKILADTKDLSAYIKKGENKKSLGIFETYSQLENFLLPVFEEHEKIFHLKELNEQIEEKGIKGISPNMIKTIFNFWATKKWIKQQHHSYSKNHVLAILCLPEEELLQKISIRQDLSRFILHYLYDKSNKATDAEGSTKEEILVEFSVLELKQAYEKQQQLFIRAVKADDIEDALFYLSRIEAIKIEGGFLVVYNKLTIERLEENSKIQYKIEDYQKLNQFYENKVQQIHIVGEYAKKMIDDYSGALHYVDDYFQLNYLSFLNKYFPGTRQNEIKRNLTPKKYRELFESLSEAQRKIIDDKTSPYIVVAAGPGSGKTKLLVHKLASLLLMEDVKTEQLLMVTFSRASVNEFKKRLLGLIGNTANYIEIKTFHSFCFDLLGKVGNLDKSDTILPETIEKIKNNEVELSRITKTVLVIDEAQDMDAVEFELIKTLMEKNEGMRVIEVGDDDQNIYGFRGADSKYMQQFITVFGGKKYELATNYRSKQNLVIFTNQFVTTISNRLKEQPIVAHQTDIGKIRIIRYTSKYLITPLIENVLNAETSGTTCVLTQTNEEAFQVTGLLLKNGMHAKLVQSNESFRLSAMREIRSFIKAITPDPGVFHIPDDLWEKAKREWIRENQNSSKFEIYLNIIRDFEITHPKKKYLSDFTNHLNESKLEDFYNETGEAIYVSTIHKAKGKEYDNVILLLDQFDSQTDEKRRQLYVAMTRAKNNLTIHLNGNYLDQFTAANLERSENTDEFAEPRELVMYLKHTDVQLGYFEFVQPRIAALKSGDELALAEDSMFHKGKPVLKFSKNFMDILSTRKSKGYRMTAAKVNFIVYWQDKEKSKAECEIVLPVVYLERIVS